MAREPTNDVPAQEVRPDITVGRATAEADPTAKPEDQGSGHPLPASEKARHGSIPESLEKARGHGAN